MYVYDFSQLKVGSHSLQTARFTDITVCFLLSILWTLKILWYTESQKKTEVRRE